MNTEAFYTTAAQVIPTLMIALAVELTIYARWTFSDLQKTVQRHGKDSILAQNVGIAIRRIRRFTWLLAIAFVFGEVLALLSVGFRWFNAGMFITIGACMLTLIIAVVLLPLVRLSGTLQGYGQD